MTKKGKIYDGRKLESHDYRRKYTTNISIKLQKLITKIDNVRNVDILCKIAKIVIRASSNHRYVIKKASKILSNYRLSRCPPPMGLGLNCHTLF